MNDTTRSARRSITPATKELHATIIRLVKGIISAWERWLQQQDIEKS
jgi:hypothetical protein